MIAVAGGILLALFIILMVVGLLAAVGNTFRFLMRHLEYVGAAVAALAIWGALSYVGSHASRPSWEPNPHQYMAGEQH